MEAGAARVNAVAWKRMAAARTNEENDYMPGEFLTAKRILSSRNFPCYWVRIRVSIRGARMERNPAIQVFAIGGAIFDSGIIKGFRAIGIPGRGTEIRSTYRDHERNVVSARKEFFEAGR